jgi:hypothetical protein
MAELAVTGPFDERDLHHDLGPDPVSAETRKADRAREWRRRSLERIEPLAQREEERSVETGADLSGVNQVLPFEIADEERAEAAALAGCPAASRSPPPPLRGRLSPTAAPPRFSTLA